MNNHEIENGDRVRVIGGDKEIFTVSQLIGNRCWIGDENGRGWYIHTYRLQLMENENLDDDDGDIPDFSFSQYFINSLTLDRS